MRKFLAGLAAGALVLCAGYALASRNSSGTMSAVNGPYVPGTNISSSQINARFADIERELTDSLSRSGKGGMTAFLKEADGTVSSPAFTFNNEPVSGLYRIGANDLGLSVNGALKHEFTGTGETVTGTHTVTGASTIGGAQTVGGTLGVTGVTTDSSGVVINAPGAAPSSFYLAMNGTSGAGDVVASWTDFGKNQVKACIQDSAGAFFLQNSSGNLACGSGTAFIAMDTSNVLYLNSLTTTITTGGAISTVGAISSGGLTSTTLATTSGTTQLGTSGSAFHQLNFGTCTLAGDGISDPSTCTAAVAAGSVCTATTDDALMTATPLAVHVVGTTLTVGNISPGVVGTVVNWTCFG